MIEDNGYNLKAVLYHNGFVCTIYYDKVTDSIYGNMTEFPEDMWEYFDYLNSNEPEQLEFPIDHMSNAYDEFIVMCEYFTDEYEYPDYDEDDDDEFVASLSLDRSKLYN